VTGASSREAVRYVRRRTLQRGAVGYARWVRDTFGYYTLAYLVFWLTVGFASTVQNAAAAPRLHHSPALLPAASALLAGVGLAWLVVTSRVPPALLSARDLTRLALTPAEPASVLAWPLWLARLSRAALGAVGGAAWALLAPVYFDVSPVLAPFALPFVLAASVDVAWLAYAARQAGAARARRFLILTLLVASACALLGAFTPLGLLAVLWSASPLAVVAPVLIAGLTSWSVTVSLRDGYPPLFASHALILGRLRALDTMTRWLGGRPDADAVRRLRAQLHGSAARRPTRFLPAPSVRSGELGALAWRSALLLYRRPLHEHALTVMWFTGLALVDVAAIQADGGLILSGVALGALLPRLIGPAPGGVAPAVTPRSRTLGRVAPGAALIVLVALVAAGIALLAGRSDVTLRVLIAGAQTVLSLVLYEKATVWAGNPAGSTETRLAVSLAVVVTVALLPTPVALGALLLVTGVAVRVPWP